MGPAGRPKFQALHILFCLGLLLASFDTFLVLDIGGVSIKSGQIFQLLFVGFYSLSNLGGGKKTESVWPIGFRWLAFWGFFLVIWTPNTHHLAFSAGYTAYFLVSCLIILTGTRYYSDNPQYISNLLKTYVTSFVVLSGFGLVQFAAAIVGIDLLVAQWWIPGILPRVNGFSLEPSYYATYLITGWGMLAYMIEKKVALFPSRTLVIYFSIVSAALILSTSRMAILVIGLYFAFFFVRGIFISVVNLKIYPKFLLAVFVVIMTMMMFFVGIAFTVGFGSLQFLLFGVGFGSGSDYSSSMRIGLMADTYQLFLDSPLIGYGLGGVWSQIGYSNGLPPGEATGMNVTVEILAASGLVGFAFFVLYLGTIIKNVFSNHRSRHWVHGTLVALGVGLILIYIILQFNQGIMRVYFWNHLAIIAILHANLTHLRLSPGSQQNSALRQGKTSGPLPMAVSGRRP